MEILTSTFLTSVVLVFLILRRLLRRSHGRRRLPPGPRGLPLLGSLPFLSPDLHRCLAGIARSYGPIVSLRLGAKLHVVITSPALATEVLRTHDTIFASHVVPATTLVLTSGEDIFCAPYGPLWRLLRKVVVREVLSSSVVDSFLPLRRREMHRKLEEIKEAEGRGVNVRDAASEVLINVMLGMMWGDEEENGGGAMGKELLDVIHETIDLFMAPNISDFFPALAPLDLQGLQRRMKVLAARFDAVLDTVVSQRVSRSTSAGGESKDFLQLLLDLIHRKDSEMPIQLKHAKLLLLDMISAGTDTTSTTVEWAMSELVRHPEAMSKVRGELYAVVGGGEVLEEAQIPRLGYLEAVVKETLRLHPPVPLLIPRTPSEACEVGGYVVPRGACVFVNVWAMQRDPSVWEEPLEFRPERFLERQEEHRGVDDFRYMPFGRGRRMCAGIELGERLVMYILGSILHSFRWQAPAGTALGMEDKFGIVLRKKDPLVLVPSGSVYP